MTRAWAVATNTFREAVRDRVLNSILAFGALLLVLSLAMKEITLGDAGKVVRGVALGGISFVGAVIAIFLGVGLVWKEIDKKTIYTLASKPLPRWELLLGKYLGLWITLAVEVLALGAIYVLVIGAQQGMPHPTVYVALAMLMLELTLLCAWATLFSTFAAPTGASAYTLGIYLIGHFTDDLLRFGEASRNPGFRALAEAVYATFPNLEAFNLRAEAAHGLTIPAGEVAWITGYGLGYTALVLGVAMLVFSKRDFA
jgi:ABC-type transport system involved in multi-copper enzyme maturation permease subunit